MRRILIVDDHPDAANAIAILLRLLGHECVTATTGRAALALAREAPFDVAILDLGLPDLSGLEVAGELRRLPSGRAMYLAAVSGWTRPDIRANALAAGFDQHLRKPIDGAAVAQLVERAASGAAVAAGAAAHHAGG